MTQEIQKISKYFLVLTLTVFSFFVTMPKDSFASMVSGAVECGKMGYAATSPECTDLMGKKWEGYAQNIPKPLVLPLLSPLTGLGIGAGNGHTHQHNFQPGLGVGATTGLGGGAFSCLAKGLPVGSPECLKLLSDGATVGGLAGGMLMAPTGMGALAGMDIGAGNGHTHQHNIQSGLGVGAITGATGGGIMCLQMGLPIGSPACLAFLGGGAVSGGAYGAAMLSPTGIGALPGLGVGAGAGAIDCAIRGLAATSPECIALIGGYSALGAGTASIGGPVTGLAGFGIGAGNGYTHQHANPMATGMHPVAQLIANQLSIAFNTCHNMGLTWDSEECGNIASAGAGAGALAGTTLGSIPGAAVGTLSGLGIAFCAKGEDKNKCGARGKLIGAGVGAFSAGAFAGASSAGILTPVAAASGALTGGSMGSGLGIGASACAAGGGNLLSPMCLQMMGATGGTGAVAGGFAGGGVMTGITAPIGGLVGLNISSNGKHFPPELTAYNYSRLMLAIEQLGLSQRSPLVPILAQVSQSMDPELVKDKKTMLETMNNTIVCLFQETQMRAENADACKRAGGSPMPSK